MIVMQHVNEIILTLLRLLPREHRLVYALIILGFVLTAYSGQIALMRMLRPRLITFELARSPVSATSIVRLWGTSGTAMARRAIVTDFFALPTLAAFSAYLCLWAAGSMRSRVLWL